MKLRNVAALTVGAVMFAVPAFAQEVGTADEAKALTERALAHAAKVGTDAAFKEFTDAKGAFVDRDLYVFCMDKSGVMQAHGGNPALVGKNLFQVKDSDGKEFIKEMLSTASASGSGWVDYKWANPISKKIEPKSSYVAKLGDGLCGVGIYKK